jgi:hypothetical protein
VLIYEEDFWNIYHSVGSAARALNINQYKKQSLIILFETVSKKTL